MRHRLTGSAVPVRILLAKLLCGLAAACGASLSFADDLTSTPRELERREFGPFPIAIGETREAQHGAGDTYIYEFEAVEGETYLIEVDQLGLDLFVAARSPNGTKRKFNSPLERDESEFVLLENTDAGAFAISIASEEFSRALGGHRITVSEMSVRSEPEIAGYRLFSNAAFANVLGDQNSWAIARTNYVKAADHWAAIDRPRFEAMSLFAASTIDFLWLSNQEAAFDLSKRSADIYLSILEPVLAARATYIHASSILEIAAAQGAGSEFGATELVGEAIDHLRKIRKVFLNQKQNFYDGLTQDKLGLASYRLGQLSNARRRWEAAATIFSENEEWAEEIKTLRNIAALDAESGEILKALSSAEILLARLPEKPSSIHTGQMLDIGVMRLILGQYQKALSIFSDALDASREIRDQYDESTALYGIGVSYVSTGELTLATSYLNQAVDLAKLSENGRTRTASLRYLGDIQTHSGNFQAALELYGEAASTAGDFIDQANAQLRKTRMLRKLEQFKKALDQSKQVLEDAITSGSTRIAADAKLEIGFSLIGLSDLTNAASTLERAYSDYRSLNSPIGQAETLRGLAIVARRSGSLDSALDFSQQALALLERTRGELLDVDQRASFSGQYRLYYDFIITILLDNHFSQDRESHSLLSDALSYSERARARTILELLAQARRRSDLGESQPLAKQKKSLLFELASTRYQYSRLQNRHGGEDRKLAQIDTKLAEISNQLNSVEAKLEAATVGDDMSISAINTLSAAEIQEAIPEDTALLQYNLGDESSYVFTVDSKAIQVTKLPARETIESAARRLLEVIKSAPNSANNSLDTQTQIDELTRLILHPPIKKTNKKKLVISADGALHFVPFHALNSLQSVADKPLPLLFTHSISMIPSMTITARTKGKDEDSRNLNTASAVVFSDPVFSTTDTRIRIRDEAIDGNSPLPNQTKNDSVAAEKLQRLIYSASESQAVAQRLGPEYVMSFSGFDATKRAALTTDLSSYDIVHLATHGTFDTRFPALSSLSLTRYTIDGLRIGDSDLRLHEVHDLNLNADLVVLSACDTALGNNIRGEGLAGFVQGFLLAGSRVVVASLWQIDDGATAALMDRFYEALIGEGQNPSLAMTAAMRWMLTQPRWQHPYYWAGFATYNEI